MAASTNKKVLIRRFDRPTLAGFVNPQGCLQNAGIELMNPQGVVALVPYEEVKMLSFVREFEEEAGEEKRFFASRPKQEGLWIRMRFRDGDFQEAVLSNDLLRTPVEGFYVIPPDAGYNSQRLFVPRAALTDLKVLGVVGATARKRRTEPPPREQISLFE